jgi:hypothetical protein
MLASYTRPRGLIAGTRCSISWRQETSAQGSGQSRRTRDRLPFLPGTGSVYASCKIGGKSTQSLPESVAFRHSIAQTANGMPIDGALRRMDTGAPFYSEREIAPRPVPARHQRLHRYLRSPARRGLTVAQDVRTITGVPILVPNSAPPVHYECIRRHRMSCRRITRPRGFTPRGLAVPGSGILLTGCDAARPERLRRAGCS